MDRLVHQTLAWASAAAMLIAAACTRPRGTTAGAAVPPSGCAVRELSRNPLLLDGNRELYIEPTVAMPSGKLILLAGRPNYLFSPGSPDTERTVSKDSIFGVVLDERNRVQTVPAPINPALVASARGIALDAGGWGVAFAELTRPWDPPRPDTVARLWYGEFDGQRWSRLEELHGPSPGTYDLELGSELIARGDTLFLAAIVRSDSAGRNVALFSRAGGRWKASLIRTRTAAYAELLHSDSLGLLVAVVQADGSLREDTNSLLIYRHSAQWEVVGRLIHGGAQPVYDPRFTSSARGVVLSWWVLDRQSRPPVTRARAIPGLTPNLDGGVLELDADINQVRPISGFTRFPVWVTDHNNMDGTRELRFLADSSGHTYHLGAIANPFTGPFAVTGVGGTDLLLTAPLFHADTARPRLVSLLIRARVECPDSAP